MGLQAGVLQTMEARDDRAIEVGMVIAMEFEKRTLSERPVQCGQATHRLDACSAGWNGLGEARVVAGTENVVRGFRVRFEPLPGQSGWGSLARPSLRASGRVPDRDDG